MSDLDEAKVRAAREDSSRFRENFERIKKEVHKFIVGQDHVIDGVLTVLFTGGHALLEGVPGIGKTMLIRTLGRALDLSFSRIQFTPDMLPADILGAHVLEETAPGKQEVVFRRGPITANLVLADEINRATPKTQSALLEAMQEKQITVGRETMPLPDPFVVLATQNPVEQEGTYPLPEAQVDRFLQKILVGYPEERDYHEILERTTEGREPEIERAADPEEVLWMRRTALSVPVPEHVRTYAIRLVMATQPGSPYATEDTNRFVELGASPRGVQGLVLSGKVLALRDGRTSVASKDIREAALPVLRHRIMLGYEARAEGVDPDRLIRGILETLPVPEA